ncbi:hypothetical protein ROSEINA2194_00673 [Roseburia inulinivorans DSM 16841]|uniref:Uncharacterized protein n=1 Tax=Roseburia inulinivorans DSM 16841 TaxID=622312 RepID=C0FPM1_9FIRM|nr:hypothetical protein ROSEINA2194_00673 [Roseburia inulinivorans DSM 16841]
MRRGIFQHRITELDPVLTEAICRAAVNIVVGGQQVHGRIVGVGVSAAAIALHGALILHPALMLLVAPKASGIVLDQQVQARGQAAVAGECFHDGLAVADHTGLDTLGQPRAAQGGTAQLFHILGTELAAHILGGIFECVDIHGVLLLA